MPNIKFDAKTIAKAKNRIGVYSTLNKPIVINTVTKVIEGAFREYISKRRPTLEMENLEWERFLKILKRYL